MGIRQRLACVLAIWTLAVASTLSGSIALAVDTNAPSLLSRTPGPGVTLTNRRANISISWKDDVAMNLTSVKLWIDGTLVAASVRYGETYDENGDPLTDPTVAILSRAYDLHDGQHTIETQAADTSGNVAPRLSWTINVAERPRITSVQPTAGTQTATLPVIVSATATDYDGISASGIVVRWREANAGRTPGPWSTLTSSYNTSTGLVSAQFTPLYREARFEFDIRVTDNYGTSNSASTNVYILPLAGQPVMPVSNCQSCHPLIIQNHPIQPCTTCHIEDCSDCHDPHVDLQEVLNKGYTCTSGGCHDEVKATAHTNQVTMSQQHVTTSHPDCGRCHTRPLTSEHVIRTPDGGGQFTCLTCHTSTDPNVSTAISNNLTNCNACHDFEGEHPGGPDCISCHGLSGAALRKIDVSALLGSSHGTLNAGAANLTGNTVNAACWACHGNGSQPTDHPANYKSPKICEDCHTGAGAFGAPQVGSHRYEAPSAPVDRTLSSSKPISGSCLACHNSSNGVVVSNADADTGTFDAEGDGVRGGGTSVEHYGTVPQLNGTTSTDCAYCHQNETNGTMWGDAIQFEDIEAHRTSYQRNHTGSGSFRALDGGSSETSTAVDGSTIWLYQDAADMGTPKQEGGYKPVETMTECVDCHSFGNSGSFHNPENTEIVQVLGPHSGYDTGSNKCKVCHAVHRAEGAFRLLRADSPDDACTYCHIGDMKHSSIGAYFRTDTVYPSNGHTMGAGTAIPGSTVKQWLDEKTLETVTSDGTTVSFTYNVREYEESRNRMFYWTGIRASYHDIGMRRLGPTFLSCLSCHQPHNADMLIWQPGSFNDGYKLLRSSPSGSTKSTARMVDYGPEAESYTVVAAEPAGSTSLSLRVEGRTTYIYRGDSLRFGSGAGAQIAVVAEGSGPGYDPLRGRYTIDESGTEVALEPPGLSGDIGAGSGCGLAELNIIRVPENGVTGSNTGSGVSVVGDGSDIHRNEFTTWTKWKGDYFQTLDISDPTIPNPRLSLWCADCHNLNIGTYESVESEASVGFRASEIHSDRTHTSSGLILECWNCHSTNMPVTDADYADYFDGTGVTPSPEGLSCNACHYYHNGSAYYQNVRRDVRKSDFPHSGGSTGFKMLGEDTSNSAGGVEAVTQDLDGLCLRCHDLVGDSM
ncbi:MAG: cytochrome c3 family protein [Candidatus Aquicultorales bacterium]